MVTPLKFWLQLECTDYPLGCSRVLPVHPHYLHWGVRLNNCTVNSNNLERNIVLARFQSAAGKMALLSLLLKALLLLCR